jgi:hypothetical protein
VTTETKATQAMAKNREIEFPETPGRRRLGRILFKNDMHQVSAIPASWWSGFGTIDHSNDTNDHFALANPAGARNSYAA